VKYKDSAVGKKPVDSDKRRSHRNGKRHSSSSRRKVRLKRFPEDLDVNSHVDISYYISTTQNLCVILFLGERGLPFRDSSVCIATGYGLDDWSSGIRFPAVAGNLSLLHRVQTGCGAHPASYPLCTGALFPGTKRPGRETDHSPPSSAQIKE
jgi:hypothetical protein